MGTNCKNRPIGVASAAVPIERCKLTIIFLSTGVNFIWQRDTFIVIFNAIKLVDE